MIYHVTKLQAIDAKKIISQAGRVKKTMGEGVWSEVYCYLYGPVDK